MQSSPTRTPSVEIAVAFGAFPKSEQDQLLQVRTLIFAVAAETDGIGSITETLKWGQPAYLTEQCKSGTTIRLGIAADMPDHGILFVHCRTSLIEEFRNQFADFGGFVGHRSIAMHVKEPLPSAMLSMCIHRALTYHQR